jgi:putative iron-regulated protein
MSSLAPRLRAALLCGAVLVLATPSTLIAADEPADEALRRDVVATYSSLAHAGYARSHDRSAALLERVEAFIEAPSAATITAAREAWVTGRKVYVQTEVFRFSNGPIDHPSVGVETFLNAWPLDEAYIDGVEGDENAGIINDPERYPALDGGLLTILNERGGEANVAIGWHAIEFLLWGQDHDPDGPGTRSPDDFVDGKAKNADRRREYLLAVSRLLVEHLAKVAKAWEPDADNYRRSFEAAPPDESLAKILTGMAILSGFEMSGERLAVAYETQDQEEEHSCFSDTTHLDFIADQQGVLAVWQGRGFGVEGRGLRDIALIVDADIAGVLDEQLAASLAATMAIPVPFDQAILGDDDAPGRVALNTTMTALEAQTESLAILADSLGFRIAIKPGE